MQNLAVKIYFAFCLLVCCLIALANYEGIYLVEALSSGISISAE